MSRRRRILVACILVWAFLLVCATIAHKWAVALAILCAPAILGVVLVAGAAAAAILAMSPTRRRRPAEATADTEVRVFPVRAPLAPPRRRARPYRAGQPAGPPREPLTGAAAARVDQEVMRQRAAAGDQAPDHDDFVALMRNAGAGDLEDVTGEDGDQ